VPGESPSTAAPDAADAGWNHRVGAVRTSGLRHGTAAVSLSEESYMTEVTLAGPAGENVQVIDKTDERYYELRVDGVFR
jgi:hypothetical protein